MFVHFRKRFGKKAICQIIETVNQKAGEADKSTKDDDKGDSGGGSAAGEEPNQIKLLIDATCTPADITFPTDLKILNEAREKVRRSLVFCTGPIEASLKSLAAIVKEHESSFLPS